LIVFEMTHEFSLVPALMIGALVSQAVARGLAKHSFYEALLLQDGHNLERVIPPRDLSSWQQLPISAIANFQAISARSLDSDELKYLLRDHPYQRFPVLGEDGRLSGMLRRDEAKAAVAENRTPRLEVAVTCLPSQTIADLQNLLIASATLAVVVLDSPGGKMLGLVTLHDLLRAEVSMARSSGA
jgi:chloride channel protein, CIC family